MKDREFATELVDRLNLLIRDKQVADFVGRFVETRIHVSDEVARHPTIQVACDGSAAGQAGFLGLVNGIVGAIRGSGEGRVVAEFDDDGVLQRFFVRDDIEK